MTENANETNETDETMQGRLLGAADIRRIAAEAGISPTKKFGQNFVIDPGTVRRIVREAGVTADDHVLEVGPGLGSLTLAILETGATMTAVEIDPPVAERLPGTIAEFMPDAVDRFRVVNRDALTVTPENLPDFNNDDSFTLVANLPYNVATPILLTLLERFDNLGTFLVMVQKEVADRLSEKPGSKIYGTPSVKLAWYGTAERVGIIGRVLAGTECGFRAGAVQTIRGRAHAFRQQSRRFRGRSRNRVPSHRRRVWAAPQNPACRVEENRIFRSV